MLSLIHTILRNEVHRNSLFLSLLSGSRKRCREVYRRGPSSWRHERGNGIKPRRAARDLLIVATGVVASVPTVAPRASFSEGLPPGRLSSLFLRLPPSYTLRAVHRRAHPLFLPASTALPLRTPPRSMRILVLPASSSPSPVVVRLIFAPFCYRVPTARS